MEPSESKPRGREPGGKPVPEPLVLNGAPSQLDRWFVGAAEDGALVDGRTLAELADFAPRFGTLINFFDLDDEVDGNWEDFFSDDPTIGLASLAAADVTLVERRLAAFVGAVRRANGAAEKLAALMRVFVFVARLARILDRGLRGAQLAPPRSPARRLVGPLVRAIDEEAGTALRTLVGYAAGAASALSAPIDLTAETSDLAARWRLAEVQPITAPYLGADVASRMDSAVGAVETLAGPFFDTVAELGASSRAALDETLATGDHAPQAALYLAFADLFTRSQGVLDTFAARLAAFYRDDVLREGRAPAIPDQVYLTFTLAEDEGVASETVPAGTLFAAGQDAQGNELLYAADRSLAVGAARIASLRTLRRVEEPLLSTLCPGEPPVDSPLVVAHGRYLQAEIALLSDELAPPPFVTFGRTTTGTTERETSTPARLGFAVASQGLLLAGGIRAVTLRATLTAESVAAIAPLLEELGAALGLTPAAAFDALLGKALRLELTTADGWLAVEGFSTESQLEADPPTFTLSFELPPAAPAIAPLTPDPETPAVETVPTRLPTLRAELIPGSLSLPAGACTVETWPWAYLAPLDVTGFTLHVDVTGLPGVAVATTDGEVDPTVPFPAFGAAPVVGSYLEVAHPELFVKVPESLEITLGWFGLPPNDDGFVGWYRDYTIALDGQPTPDLFDNAKFEGAWRVVEPGAWFLNPVDELCPDVPSIVPEILFRTRPDCEKDPPDASGPLCPATRFTNLGVCTVPSGAPPYYDPARSALRLELTAPSYTFGDDLYSINVLAAVLADLPDTNSCSDKCLTECAPLKDDPVAYAACLESCLQKCLAPPEQLKYPNAPYLPTLERVAVDYAATVALPAATAGEAFYHLAPFGGVAPAAPGVTGAAPLLPRVAAEGQLLLGFNGLKTPRTLTMLVTLTAGSSAAAAGDGPTWSFLTGNRWVPLAGQQILFDGTHGMTGSGLVALALPACPLDDHTVLPATGEEPEQWLRVAVGSGAAGYPPAVQIYPHALVATAVLEPGMGEHLATPLPAGTITAAVEELPNISTVMQPLESFGGRPQEGPEAYAVRLAERLRHKDRAVQSWDYERLVLERFPTIWKTQALPARDTTGPRPGHVLVMVVPGAASQEAQDPTVPRAPSTMLGTIADYLAARATPFATIHVANPSYVRITVTAALDLAVDAGADFAKLEAELVRYLSPAFYDAERAARGGRYASEEDIADWLASRPEVRAIESISFAYDPPRESLPWYFLTSAESHLLYPAGTVPPDPDINPCRGAEP